MRTLQLRPREHHDSNGAIQLVAPPAGLPADTSTLPGLGDVTGASIGFDVPVSQHARYTSAPVDHGIEIIGVPHVRLEVRASRPSGLLFVRLLDVAPDGRRLVPRGLVSALRVDSVPPLGGDAARTVDVALPAVAWRLAPGHRMGIEITTTDAGYVAPTEPIAFSVRVAGSGLRIPQVQSPKRTPDTFEAGVDWHDLIALALLILLVAVGGGVVIARSVAGRDRRVQEPALCDTPLRARGLTKRFSDGRLAVSDVTFTVERGSIVGLVGPNGAGKTTTLRMLLGLVHPSDGFAHVFGQRIRAGVPHLSRVGALVEGPGLVPHLTGRQHLQRYWSATRGSRGDAAIDQTLELVGLSADADRVVRTWSHGMRQRLAIAQALLGAPDLVLLDEPVNGLDPVQIAQLRTLVRDIAASGRAVLLSSHLLGELERVCTHVVLMAEGSVLRSGTLAEVVGEHEDLEAAFLAHMEEARSDA
jgi:ABC-2 type transport system ATP-binding protein